MMTNERRQRAIEVHMVCADGYRQAWREHPTQAREDTRIVDRALDKLEDAEQEMRDTAPRKREPTAAQPHLHTREHA